jgi:hypothetical protein
MKTGVRKPQKNRAGFAVVLLAALLGAGCSSVAPPPPTDAIEVPASWNE